jgi:hypothetical protein
MGTKAGQEIREENWSHNGLLGAARMILRSAQRVVQSTTASGAAKATAQEIIDLSRTLDYRLRKERIIKGVFHAPE